MTPVNTPELPFWLSDIQWARIAPLLPDKTRGVPRVPDRRVISGIIAVLASGCAWKDAPATYGPHKTLYNRYRRWTDQGVWPRVFAALAAVEGPAAEPLIAALGGRRARPTEMPRRGRPAPASGPGVSPEAPLAIALMAPRQSRAPVR